MTKADLKASLIKTCCDLLDSKKNIELQIIEAKKVIEFSLKQVNEGKMTSFSIDRDAVWLKYLLKSLSEIDSNIELAKKALSQLGVSYCDSLVVADGLVLQEKNQGEALDFSISKEC